MKFLASLAVAASLVSSAVAAASKDAAPVFILRKQDVTTGSTTGSAADPPRIPRQIVRQILLQRIHAADEASGYFDALPKGYDPEATIDLINRYGLAAAPLFSERKAQPAQLVLMLEGVKPDQAKRLGEALPSAYRQPSFAVADPPSHAANARFLVSELAQAGITAQQSNLQAAFGGDFPSYWAKQLHVGLYDVAENSDVVAVLEKNMGQVISLVESGEIEVTLVLLPESSRSSKLQYWTTTAPRAKTASSDELRRLRVREAESESVMIEESDTSSSSKDENKNDKNNNGIPSSFEWAATAPTAVPACFQSFNSCVTQTGNCSSHGVCVDKYAYNSGGVAKQSGAASCFVCHCYSTLNRPEDAEGGLSTTQWAGGMCQKKDISSPFWLLTGFTVTIIGIVSFAIGMLFNVGEEKLPGVIGAGVSRAK